MRADNTKNLTTTSLSSGPVAPALMNAYHVMKKSFYEAIADPEKKTLGVVFDADGTLLESKGAFYEAFNKTAEHFISDENIHLLHKYKAQSPDEQSSMLLKRDRLKRFDAEMFGDVDKFGNKNNPENIMKYHDSQLVPSYINNAEKLPNADSALRVLHSLKAGLPIYMALGSASTLERVIGVAQKFGWDKIFDSVNGEVKIKGEKDISKYNPDFPEYLFKNNGGVIPDNVTVIGDDHQSDYNMAKFIADANKAAFITDYSKGVGKSNSREVHYISFAESPKTKPIAGAEPNKLDPAHPHIDSWVDVDMIAHAANAAIEEAIADGVIKDHGGKTALQRVTLFQELSASLKENFVKKAPVNIVLPSDSLIFDNVMHAVNYGWEQTVKGVLRECLDGKHDDKFGKIISGYNMLGLALRTAGDEDVESMLDKLTQIVIEKRQSLIDQKLGLTPLELLEQSYGVLADKNDSYLGAPTLWSAEIAKKIGGTLGNKNYLEKYLEGFEKLFKEGVIKVTPEADALFKNIAQRQANGEDVRLLRTEHKRQRVMDGFETQIISERYPSLKIDNRGMHEAGGTYIKPFPYDDQEKGMKTVYLIPTKDQIVETKLSNATPEIYDAVKNGSISVMAIDPNAELHKAGTVTLKTKGREPLTIEYPISTMEKALKKIDRHLSGEPKYTFEVIDKNTPNYLDLISKDMLTMLIHMLEDLGHGNEVGAKKAYGYPKDDKGVWDEAKLAEYKAGTLTNRFTKEGYTFFPLKNEQGQLVGLCSGDASADKTDLHLRNITISREHQGEGHVKSLIKNISNFAAENEFKQCRISLSTFAQNKGRPGMYQHVLKELGIEQLGEFRKKEDGGIELLFLPKRFKAEEKSATEEKSGWLEKMEARKAQANDAQRQI